MGREINPELNLLQNLLLFIRRDTRQGFFFFKRDYNVLYTNFFAMLTVLAVAGCKTKRTKCFYYSR